MKRASAPRRAACRKRPLRGYLLLADLAGRSTRQDPLSPRSKVTHDKRTDSDRTIHRAPTSGARCTGGRQGPSIKRTSRPSSCTDPGSDCTRTITSTADCSESVPVPLSGQCPLRPRQHAPALLFGLSELQPGPPVKKWARILEQWKVFSKPPPSPAVSCERKHVRNEVKVAQGGGAPGVLGLL